MTRTFSPALLVATAFMGATPLAHALTLGVTEGLTYRATDQEIQARFEPIASHLAAAIKQPVEIKVLGSYKALRQALVQRQLDVAFVHPAHVALEATKAGQYAPLAWTRGYTDYRVSFLCKQAQPSLDWASLKDKKLVTTDPDSITAVIARAMLREHGLAPGAPQLLTTRYQDAVPFYVQHAFADYGATAAKAVIQGWVGQGGALCAQSRPVPIKQWIASTALPAATASGLRAALLAMPDSEAGRKALATSAYLGFDAPKDGSEKDLIDWLGL